MHCDAESYRQDVALLMMHHNENQSEMNLTNAVQPLLHNVQLGPNPVLEQLRAANAERARNGGNVSSSSMEGEGTQFKTASELLAKGMGYDSPSLQVMRDMMTDLRNEIAKREIGEATESDVIQKQNKLSEFLAVQQAASQQVSEKGSKDSVSTKEVHGVSGA